MAQKPEGQRKIERMMIRSAPDEYGLSTPISAPEEERIQLPDSRTGIGPHDVLCGRGKESFNHGKCSVLSLAGASINIHV